MPHDLLSRAATGRRAIRVTTLAVALLLALGACTSSGSGGPAPTPGPGGSGAAGACPTVATPDSVPGWGPPASPPPVIAGTVNSELVCGENRLLIGIVDKEGRPIGGPDTTVKLALYDLGRDATKPTTTLDTTFVWAIQDVRALYVATTSFGDAGVWGAEVTVTTGGAAPTTIRATFPVRATGSAKRVGDKAPATKTPTLADVGGDAAKVSTDQKPDKRLYETSVNQAIQAGKPFVLAFATPKFCASAQCGPTLDRVKPFIDAYPTVTFINVEPYKLVFKDGSLQADVDAQGQLQATDTTNAWGILSEPWVYVVDRTGVIRASFEGVFADDELRAALDAVK